MSHQHMFAAVNTNSHAASAAPSPQGSPICLCQALIRGMGIDDKATRYIAISRYIAITHLGFSSLSRYIALTHLGFSATCSQGQGHLCCSISPFTRAHTQSLPLPSSPSLSLSLSLPFSLSLSLSLPPSLSLSPFLSLSPTHTRAHTHTGN